MCDILCTREMKTRRRISTLHHTEKVPREFSTLIPNFRTFRFSGLLFLAEKGGMGDDARVRFYVQKREEKKLC